MSDSPHVLDVTTDAFQSAVLEESMNRPVVVDFWAPWCGPCRQLGPIIEALADEYGGRFLLAKVNTEAEPMLAQAVGVSSIPLVLAIANGQPVEQFVGLKSEAEIRQWLDSFVPPGEAGDPLADAQALEETDPAAAEVAYRSILESEADSVPAAVGLARTLLKLDRDDESIVVLDGLAARRIADPDAAAVRSEIELRAKARESGGVAQARAALADSPDDDAKKLALAEALASERGYGEASELCLDVYAKNKSDEARELLLRVLDLMPAEDETAIAARRRLANLMY